MILILLLQIICCAFLTGLIWVIQILHYPAFARIANDQFAMFHLEHSNRITWIVGPVMLLELATAVLALYLLPESIEYWVSGGMLIVIWLSTFFLSVPIHNQLAKYFNGKLAERLVLTNWPRTVLWSARLVVLTFFFLKLIAPRQL